VEFPCIELIDGAFRAGFRPAAIGQMMRAAGSSLRRLAETASAVWRSGVIMPAAAQGKRPDEVLGADVGDRPSALTRRAVIAMYHLQQDGASA